MSLRKILLLPIAIISIGCQSSTLPNPNDPADVGALSPDNLRDQLTSISDALNIHRTKREITEKEYHELLKEAADRLLIGYDSAKIDPLKAWKYGEALITAEKWSEAKIAYEIAVASARAFHNEDRRVNDTLRLARVLGETGHVAEAIKTARTVFNAKPVDAAPILFGVQYEIVKASRGKGKDVELAHLVEDAIAITMRVEVDPNSDAGRSFINLRPRHIGQAWGTIASLYKAANLPVEAEKAQTKGDVMNREFAQELPRRI